MDNRKIYSVSSVNQYIKDMFSKERALSVIFVRGEISNCKYHSSGHIYFSIKDAASQMACVMWRSDARNLKFKLEDGKEVVIGGSIDVFERDGRYQLYAKKVSLAGDGFLAEKYEKLKNKLNEAGYFDEDRKIPIPQYAKSLGIVTAQTGAAIQDIINIATRRNPYMQLYLYPAIVQGKEAAESIAAGIKALEKKKVDIIIVGRGGGSIEDLWAFNEEIVAKAIYECKVAVISAVGHETDYTIADFVADLRAPTPSAAAELAVFDVRHTIQRIYEMKTRLARKMLSETSNYYEKIENLENRLKRNSPRSKLNDDRQRITNLEEKLSVLMNNICREKKYKLGLLAGKLDGLSPLKKMESGFCYISDASENKIDSIENIKINDNINITLKDGKINAKVTGIDKSSKKIL